MSRSSLVLVIGLLAFTFTGLTSATAAPSKNGSAKTTTKHKQAKKKKKKKKKKTQQVRVQTVIGPKGTTGAPGPSGLSGPRGPSGQPGGAGPAGPAGQNGTPGTTGVSGPAGSDGTVAHAWFRFEGLYSDTSTWTQLPRDGSDIALPAVGPYSSSHNGFSVAVRSQVFVNGTVQVAAEGGTVTEVTASCQAWIADPATSASAVGHLSSVTFQTVWGHSTYAQVNLAGSIEVAPGSYQLRISCQGDNGSSTIKSVIAANVNAMAFRI